MKMTADVREAIEACAKIADEWEEARRSVGDYEGRTTAKTIAIEIRALVKRYEHELPRGEDGCPIDAQMAPSPPLRDSMWG